MFAHPDDEVLFAGGLLLASRLQIEWTFACLTGHDTNRGNDLKTCAGKLGVDSTRVILLGFNDSGDVPSWSPPAATKETATGALKELMEKADFVLTHGTDGEYGHTQHKFASALCTDAVDKAQIKPILLHFGWPLATSKKTLNKVRKEKPTNKPVQLTKGILAGKQRLLDIYNDQTTNLQTLQAYIPEERITLAPGEEGKEAEALLALLNETVQNPSAWPMGQGPPGLIGTAVPCACINAANATDYLHGELDCPKAGAVAQLTKEDTGGCDTVKTVHGS